MSEVGNIFDSDESEKIVIEHRERLERAREAHPERCVLADAPVLPLPFPAYAEEAGWPRADGFEVDEEKRDANLEARRLNHINPNYLQDVARLAALEKSLADMRGLQPGSELADAVVELILEHDYVYTSTGYGLRVAVEGGSRDLLGSLSGFIDTEHGQVGTNTMVYCPGTTQDPDGIPGDGTAGGNNDTADGAGGDFKDEDGAPLELFHRNHLGKVCFTPTEASRANKHIAALELDERVKACLQYKRFVLPQQTTMVQGTFCNEAVYGQLNVLSVTGLVKMEPLVRGGENVEDENDEDPQEDQEEVGGPQVLPQKAAASFSVWPSKAAKRESRTAAQKFISGGGSFF